jgi:hypothetical protein
VGGNTIGASDAAGLLPPSEPGLGTVCIECAFIPVVRLVFSLCNLANSQSISTTSTAKSPVVNWPPNNGFSTTPNIVTLRPGTIIDRYGNVNGNFTAPAGTPFSSRSLPNDAVNLPLNTYQVIKPIDGVASGISAPWFGQPGGGVQHQLPNTVQQLIESGYLLPK